MIISDTNLGYYRKVVVQCEQCNKTREVSWHSAKEKTKHICRSCSSKNMIQNHPESFKNCPHAMAEANREKARQGHGRIQSGYKQIYMPEHPSAVGGGRKRILSNGQNYISYGQYVYEHNLVIEHQTGKHPEDHEMVHHINGNKLDNRIENLYLCSGVTRKESAQIHNSCHKSAEKLTMTLVDKGLAYFKDGQYYLKDKVAALFADVFER